MLHTKVKKIMTKRVLMLQTIFSVLNGFYNCLIYCFPKIAALVNDPKCDC